MDTSLLRPGCLDLTLFMKPSDEKSRNDILLKVTSIVPISSNMEFNRISFMIKDYSGADLVTLCRFAAIPALQNNYHMISNSNFENVLNIVKPSIATAVHNWYFSYEKKLTSGFPKFNDKIFYR